MYYGVLIAMAVWLLAGAIDWLNSPEGSEVNRARATFSLLLLIVMGIVFGAIVELFQGTL